MKYLITILGLVLVFVNSQAQEIEFKSTEAPKEITFESQADGYMWIEVLEKPKDWTPSMEVLEPKGAICAPDALQARVPKGAIRLKLSNRFNKKTDGKVRMALHFAKETDSSEPNSEWEKARKITLNQVFETALMPQGEDDWFVFEAPGPGYVRAIIPEPPKDLSGTVEFFAVKGKPAGRNFVKTDGGEMRARLFDQWNTFASPEPFKIRFVFIPEMDSFEPNDMPADSVLIEPGLPYTAVLAPNDDQDWFKVKISVPGYLVPEILDGPKMLVDWGLLGDPKGQPAWGQVFNVNAGEYFICMKSHYGESSFEPFTFRIRFIPQFDELISADKAPVKVELSHKYRMGLVNPAEVHRLAVELPAYGFLHVRTSLDNENIIRWTVKQGNADPRELNGAALAKGPAEITATSNSGPILRPFTMELEFMADPDQNEPNGTEANAKPLEIGKDVSVLLNGNNDVDWFRFDLEKPGLVYIQTSEVSGAGPECFQIDLLGSDGKVVSSQTKTESWTAAWLYRLTPGRWHLRLTQKTRQAVSLTMNVDVVPEGELDLKLIHPNGMGIALIGLETDPGATAALRILARRCGGSFRNVSNVASLEVAMREAKVKAGEMSPVSQQASSAKSKGWLWVTGSLGLLIVIVIISLILRKRQP